MNNHKSQNYLIKRNREHTLKDFFKLAVSFAEKSHTVLYISSEPLKKLPQIEAPDKDILKRIIFIYFDHIDLVTSKLLELHSWAIVPKLILIDSIQTFSFPNESIINIEKYSLMISSLLNSMEFLNRKLNGNCISVVSVDCTESSSFERQFQILIDLYYYKMIIDDIDELSRNVV